MTRRKRRNHSAEFKVKVALAAIKGDHTLAELSTQFDLHQNQIIDWKNQLLEQSVNIFSRPTAQQEPEIDLKALHAKIGHQALQIDFFRRCAQKNRAAERQKMIDKTHQLSVRQQSQLIQINRSTLYYKPKEISSTDLSWMRLIDEIHLDYPFMGSRMIRDMLQRQGHQIGRRKVRRLMRLMGIHALYPKPNTSKPNLAHRIFPYLLKNMVIDHSNQVWCTDITYIPMAKGFVYLCAVIDWHSRKVLAHRVSISMETDFCIDALQEAIVKYGCPEVFNTDQGSQFTSEAFLNELKLRNIRISMDGKGRWMDNVMIERLWRSVKHEEVYLKAYDTVKQAKQSIAEYLDFYNMIRPHSSLNKATPNEFYDQHLLKVMAA
ncbi:IS3-like element ISAcsp5 family transposase [Acinetobacter schindleri]|uniref:IS3-like element ISAcsp5 family transposase n=1 Tax=Acinetobacter schindleri TaxID=108981 RepID=UPI0022F40711|nr:IS3-like element ISAcsp5 family transposase [Acinetobacter schindleri]WBX37006.1 IS3 family transposase [Acinetobacter schindleri]WBX37489.1 IS3 family transposase [Acinetobacter schindleri]